MIHHLYCGGGTIYNFAHVLFSVNQVQEGIIGVFNDVMLFVEPSHTVQDIVNNYSDQVQERIDNSPVLKIQYYVDNC